MLQISVIIPVYNAEKFIRRAVESAVIFDEIKEVILVEDKSPDNALSICKALEKEYNKVMVLQHPGKENRGAAASRNLGILNAHYEFIAFLDADDFYLPNRFDAENRIFNTTNDIDGVYGAVDAFYYSEEAKDKFKKTNRIETSSITKIISSERLKYVLLGMDSDYYGSGFFHLDALTVKRTLIEKVGMFNEKLRLHQDTDLIIKLAFMGNLTSGILDSPVAYRGIHGENRISSVSNIYKSRYLMFLELEIWSLKNIIDEEKAKRFIRKERIIYYQLESNVNSKNKILSLISLFKQEPYLLYLENEFTRLIKGTFGDILLIKTINKIKILLFRLILSKRITYWEAQFYQLDSSSPDKN
jgi:glycosyltransferase involved in cell wall biosynthesis